MRNILALIVFLFLLNFVSAVSLDYDCPSKVQAGEEFTCTISVTDGQGTYDLKFDLTKDGKNIAKIYNEDKGEFQSAYYYLKESLNSEEQEKIRIIIQEEGNLEGSIKLRQKDKVNQFDLTIKVGETEELEEQEEDKEEEIEKSQEKEVIKESESINTNKLELKKPKQTIILGEKQTEAKEDVTTGSVVYESKNSKVMKYLPYILSLFLMLIIFFLIREKL